MKHLARSVIRTIAGALACFAAMQSISSAAPPSNQPTVVYLRGYYRLDVFRWQPSDRSAWYLLPDAPWADKPLVNWGYVPAEHDGKRYYCLIEHQAPIGTRLFVGAEYFCGDPESAKTSYYVLGRPGFRQ